MKYTIETRLYNKNNKDIIDYFNKVKNHYNYIFRKVYYIFINDPTINISSLNTMLQCQYSISKRTASSIIKTVQGRMNSIKELKKVELRQTKYRLEKISEEIEKLVPILLEMKLQAKENKIKDLVKYRNLKTKVTFLKIRKDKLMNKIISLTYQIENNKFKLTFGTKKLFRQDLEKFLNKRDNQILFLGSKDETSCNSTFQLKYIAKINQFMVKVRKDFHYKDAKGDKRYAYGKCFFNYHKNLLKEILKLKSSPLTYRILIRGNKYYLQCMFEIDSKIVTRSSYGTIGIDFNKGFLAVSQTNRYGHLVDIDKLTYRFGNGNKSKNDLLLAINKLTKLAINTGKDIVIEDLNFLKTKSKTLKGKSTKGKKYNKMLHSLAYKFFIDRMEQICNRKNVGLIKVNPAWTSWIAKNKYCNQMKLNIHIGASFVIARRGMDIHDSV